MENSSVTSSAPVYTRNLFSQVDIVRLKYIHKLLEKDGLNIAGIRTLLALIPCWAIRHCSNNEHLNPDLNPIGKAWSEKLIT